GFVGEHLFCCRHRKLLSSGSNRAFCFANVRGRIAIPHDYAPGNHRVCGVSEANASEDGYNVRVELCNLFLKSYRSMAHQLLCSRPSSRRPWPTCCCSPSSFFAEPTANGISKNAMHGYFSSDRNGTNFLREKSPTKAGEPRDSTGGLWKK